MALFPGPDAETYQKSYGDADYSERLPAVYDATRSFFDRTLAVK